MDRIGHTKKTAIPLCERCCRVKKFGQWVVLDDNTLLRVKFWGVTIVVCDDCLKGGEYE